MTHRRTSLASERKIGSGSDRADHPEGLNVIDLTHALRRLEEMPSFV
jgi:hypothetical protein